MSGNAVVPRRLGIDTRKIRSVWPVIAEAEGETGRFVTAFFDLDRSAQRP